MGLKLFRLLRQTSEIHRAAEQGKKRRRRGDGETGRRGERTKREEPVADDAIENAEGDHAAADGLTDLGGGGNTGIDGGGGDGEAGFYSPPGGTRCTFQTRSF